VAFHRRIDEPEPANRPAGSYEVRRARSTRVATGTLACPLCDAPVALTGAITPSSALGCPYCRHEGAARDFLSLGEPTRPQRVVVRIGHRRR
jgi:hypothetical protein